MHRPVLHLSVLLWGLVLVAFAAEPVGAQYFGKNKVQYDEYDWSILETDNFHVYYYQEEEEAAHDAARMAERSYAKLAKLLNHDVVERIPLILYASHTDFQQTNALAGLINEGTGGVTEFLKRRVVLPFTGSYAEFDHVLTHELVHAFQIDILFGPEKRALTGRLGSTPPLWVMEGMAEYLSVGDVDEHTKMWLRDASLEGYLISIGDLSHAADIRVYRFGQSIMAFIAERYGLQTIGELLKTFAQRGSLDRAVRTVLGISVADLSREWTESVRKEHLPQIAEFKKPEEYGYRLTDQDNDLSRLNLAPAVSPDGDLMVYLSDKSLYNDIYLASAIDGKIMGKLVEGERTADFESLRFLSAALSWSPDQQSIALAAKKGGEDAIYIIDAEDGDLTAQLTFGFDGIQSPSFSPDGQQIVFVGLERGRSDLFVTDLDGTELTRLTNDRFADRDPHWSPDGRYVVFTTDRGAVTNFRTLDFGEFRTAIFDLEAEQIRVLPNQWGKNISPQWSPDGTKIAFISDRSGISNIYVTDVQTNETFRLTNVLTGITGLVESSPALSWSHNGDRMVFSVFTRGGWDIYAIKDPLKLMADSPLVEAVVPGAEGDAGGTAIGGLLARGAQAVAGVAGGGSDPSLASDAMPDDASTSAQAPEPTRLAETESETSHVTAGPQTASLIELDDEAEFDEADLDEALDAEEPLDVSFRPEAPDGAGFTVRDYTIDFSPDTVIGAGAFAPGLGAAGQLAMGLSDVLGNHHIQLVANVFGDIADSDVFLTYMNLERRNNWGASIFQFRNDYLSFQDNAIVRIDREIYRGAEVFVRRPFSKFRRLELGLQGVSVDRGNFDSSIPDARSSLGIDFDGRVFFVRPEVAHVTDNVLFGSTGPISGARTRLSAARSFGDLQFTTLLADLRKYINVRQRYVFAFRAMGLSSFGKTPQSFRIGGPYTVRGYSFEQFRGFNVAVTNTEFRFPMVEYLALGWPLPLAFRNIRGALFFDAGAAFDRHDSFRAFDSSKGGLVALDDIHASYGLSARTNLGFLILRWDLAQRTDLTSNIGKSISTLAIGAEF